MKRSVRSSKNGHLPGDRDRPDAAPCFTASIRSSDIDSIHRRQRRLHLPTTAKSVLTNFHRTNDTVEADDRLRGAA
ncbi:MAG: hypothetical protein MZU97_21980 [Bacillus subtilis]|nr:hypothetical protein [Bacillus subtilis]